jgi:hypothetical protein
MRQQLRLAFGGLRKPLLQNAGGPPMKLLAPAAQQ